MKRFRSVPMMLAATVYLCWFAAFLWLLCDGRYMMYLSRRLWPLLLLGCISCATLVIGILSSNKIATKENESREDLLNAAIMLIPILYFLLYQGDTLGSFALERRVVSMVESIECSDLASSAGDTLQTDIYILLNNYPSVFGRQVVLEGALNTSSSQPVLYRFLIVCCLNDAIPKAIFFESNCIDTLENDVWLRLEGTVDSLHINGIVYPFIRNTAVTVLPKPGSPYMYP
ncbi:MAG: hypothetical protein KAR40_03875 [Candidatus Sabulitectum sp.]|nr:hypothetical protein [Candidatus Sabulitectum sp.]